MSYQSTMEHHHHLLQLSPPPPHLMMSPTFFDVGAVFADVIVPSALDDVDGGDWVEDLMHLGELFGAGDGDDDDCNNVAVSDAAVCGGGDDEMLQAWQKCEGDGRSPEQPSCGDGDGDGEGEVSPPPDGENSAARKRRDRSKTIVSERKRRVRMKEKLYELRALVPNITKMDKASIIADAVVYIKDLQAHARKLKDEVALLEARPAAPQARRAAAVATAAEDEKGEGSSSGAGGARVTHVGAAQVGEGRFFVTVECEPAAADVGGGGVAAALCAAVESLSCFRVESSTLGCSPDRVVSTLTLKVSEGELDATAIIECTVKLWVMAALLKEGFRPKPTVEIS